MYQPKSIDTSRVQLPLSISELIEHLAGHSHDVWARQRITDGWTYGPRRDDARKQPRPRAVRRPAGKREGVRS